MSRESKILTAGALGAQNTISHYESFGWELLSLNGDQITMSRETQNPVYPQLVGYQARYEEKINELKSLTAPATPEKPSFSLSRCLFLLLLAVLPGLIYIGVKIAQFVNYNRDRDAYTAEVSFVEKRKQELLAEIDEITRKSRATFFARHD